MSMVKEQIALLKARYPLFFKFDKFDLNILQSVYNQVKDVDKYALILYNEDIFPYIGLALLLGKTIAKTRMVISVTELIDVYVGNSEVYRTVAELAKREVFIYVTGKEKYNSQFGALAGQLFETQFLNKDRCYVIIRGNTSEYTNVLNQFREHNLPIIHVTTKAGFINSSEDDTELDF